MPSKSCVFSLYLFTSLLITCCSSSDVTFVTDPSPGNNESFVYVAADIGHNVTVRCAVIIVEDSSQVLTSWRNAGDNEGITFTVQGRGTGDYENFTISDSLDGFSVLNITIFTSDLDRLKIACSDGGVTQQFIFFYGIPAITLLNSSSTYTITESEDFFLDLTNYNKTSFPPLSDESGTWTLDGVGLSNDSIGVTVTAYTITIKNITRNYTGRIFNITVSNMAGKRSEEFTVDVVYQPEVAKGDVQLYSSIGNSVNITATTKIKGNPTPNITWVSPNNTEIMPGGRYYQSSDTPGILTINDLQLSDFGVYRFIASNGVGNDATLDISLTLLVEPGEPKNLSYNLFNTSGVILEWDPPTQVGVPPFTGYTVSLVSDSGFNHQAIMTYSTDSTMLKLASVLTPGTQYNISVRATSSFFVNGGDYSEKVSFRTPTTGVSIDSVIGVSRDGHIEVQWSLRTTGGHDINTIQVTISCTTASPGTTASYECSWNCFDSALNGSMRVGPVDAGFKYTCSLTVRAERYFETVVSSNIDSSTGIPSAPSVTINGNVIHLLTHFIGTSSERDFRFNVLIKNEANMAVNESVYIGKNETYITIDTLAAGTYQVEATSENNYGTSDLTPVELIVERSSTPSPIINVTNTNEVDIAFVAGVGGASVGVVFLVILLVIIFIGLAIHRKTKYNSTTFVSNGGTFPAEKRKFDRARIPSVGSTVLY